MIKLLLPLISIIFNLTITSTTYAKQVEQSEIHLIQFKERTRTQLTTLVCLDFVPGRVVSKKGVLQFTSSTQKIRQLKKNNEALSKIVRELKLKARAARICKTVSKTSSPAALAQNLAKTFIMGASPAAKLNQRLGSAGQVLVSSSIGTRSTLSELLTQLQSILSCASLTLTTSGLAIDFGTGCPIGGVTITGTATIGLNIANGSFGIDLAFSSLSAGQATLSGSSLITLSTETAKLSLDLSVLASGTNSQLTFEGTLTEDTSGLLLNGTGTVSSSNLGANFSLQAVHFSNSTGACPDAGIADFAIDGPDVTVTFSGATPSSGEISVQYDSLTPTTAVISQCVS